MAKAGRKRKPNMPRNDKGRIAYGHDRETADQARSTAIAQRIRLFGANNDNALSQEWESPLGRMRMAAKIACDDAYGLSDRQHQAIKRYILARYRHRIAQGFPAEAPKSISGELVSAGISLSAHEMDDEEVFRRAREYNGARSALLEYAQRGVEYVQTLESLARDEDQPREALGVAREAANVLARWWGM